VVTVLETSNENSIYHKDLLPVVFVIGDLDSPLYGMFDTLAQLNDETVSPLLDKPIEQYMINQPDNPYEYSLK
jgi:hypothetical protein